MLRKVAEKGTILLVTHVLPVRWTRVGVWFKEAVYRTWPLKVSMCGDGDCGGDGVGRTLWKPGIRQAPPNPHTDEGQ